MTKRILSLSEFRSDARDLLEELRETGASLVLTQNKRARAVVEDYERHEAREQALVMLRFMVQGEADVAADRPEAHEEVFERLRRRVTARVADE